MKSKREDYHICFTCTDEFIIVPLKIMENFLKHIGQSERIYIPREELFPDGYVEYLEKVLNTNRQLPEFSYDYAGEHPLTKTGILKIMQKQLGCMVVSQKYGVGKVRLVQCGGRVTGFELGDIIRIQR